MLDSRNNLINSALRKGLIRFRYPLEVMITCVRWYVAYPLSLRHVEEMMRERGVFVDHTTVALLHGGRRERGSPKPQQLMLPRLRYGRISGFRHPACH